MNLKWTLLICIVWNQFNIQLKATYFAWCIYSVLHYMKLITNSDIWYLVPIFSFRLRLSVILLLSLHREPRLGLGTCSSPTANLTRQSQRSLSLEHSRLVQATRNSAGNGRRQSFPAQILTPHHQETAHRGNLYLVKWTKKMTLDILLIS